MSENEHLESSMAAEPTPPESGPDWKQTDTAPVEPPSHPEDLDHGPDEGSQADLQTMPINAGPQLAEPQTADASPPVATPPAAPVAPLPRSQSARRILWYKENWENSQTIKASTREKNASILRAIQNSAI